MKKYLWLLMAVLALLAGCGKDPVPEDPDTPGTPAEELPKPPYEVKENDFSTFRDGLKIGGYVYTPNGLPGKKPAVILCTGLDGTWADTKPYAEAATTLGLVSCCFDFCGGPDEESQSLSGGTKADNSVLTEIEDLGAVYNAIVARDDVDPNKIFLMGGSQGGLVTALYAADNPSDVMALGLMFPAFNLPDLVRTYASLIPGGIDNMTEPVSLYGHKFYPKYVKALYNLYPFDVIGNYKGPVLIMHGNQDDLVPITTSEKALEKYEDAMLIPITNQGHGFDEASTALAIQNLENFLKEQLNISE